MLFCLLLHSEYCEKCTSLPIVNTTKISAWNCVLSNATAVYFVWRRCMVTGKMLQICQITHNILYLSRVFPSLFFVAYGRQNVYNIMGQVAKGAFF